MIGLRDKYEAHHKCRFTLEAINAAVYLSERYIPDRYLPDKAIDLIDEAGSRACMNAYKKNKEQQTCILSMSPDEYWQEIRAVRTMHDMVGIYDFVFNNMFCLVILNAIVIIYVS